MKILTVADVDPDPTAGAAGTEVRTIAELRAMGHEVDSVWAADLGRRIRHGNLHYLVELPRSMRRAVIEALSRASYDVLHVNQPHGWLAAEWIRGLSGGRPVFVHRSHGFEPYADEVVTSWQKRMGADSRSHARRLASAAVRRLLARHGSRIAGFADGHVVSTTLDRDFLAERFGVDRERIAVIPQAAPEEYLEQPAPAMTAERLRRVLYVGQFAFFKAPMVVAGAMRRLAATHELTWVCARAHHERVRALAGPAVTLLDWMPVERLREVYDAHGVFLFPSFYEGFGKTFIEAMSRGLCVVASDVGGAHDVIDHGRDGILVPPGDAEALADGVRALDLGRAASMSEAAAIKARRFTWSRVARELVAFYESLLERR